MLTIGKLRDPNYYLAQVADGLEEYYTNTKEAPGMWMGSSAERLGLAGEVDGEALHRVLDHHDPKTGTRLTRAQGAPKVPGFDATFCAPKSVSLLFALGAPEVSNEVRNAHDAAVGAAVRALEDFAARSRRGKGGAERMVAEGFVAAAFRHRTSRAGDPHLHTCPAPESGVLAAGPAVVGAGRPPALRLGQDRRLSLRGRAPRRADPPPGSRVDAGPAGDRRHPRHPEGDASSVLPPPGRDRGPHGRAGRDHGPGGPGRHLRHPQA